LIIITAGGLVAADHHPRAALGVAQLAADQVAFHQDLLLQVRKLVHRQAQSLFHLGQFRNDRQTLRQHGTPLRLFGPSRKRTPGKVAGEPDPRRQYDRALAARRVGQFRWYFEKWGNFHINSAFSPQKPA